MRRRKSPAASENSRCQNLRRVAPGKRPALATSRKKTGGTVLVACSLLNNLARRLDVSRASAVVCRLALRSLEQEGYRDIATVLRWIADELHRDVEVVERLAAGSRDPDRAKESLAVDVSRAVLNDIHFRLSLVVRFATDCCATLSTPTLRAGGDVIAMLDVAVTKLIERQIARIHVINQSCPKGRKVVAIAGDAL